MTAATLGSVPLEPCVQRNFGAKQRAARGGASLRLATSEGGVTVSVSDSGPSDENLMNAAALYIVANGKLSQSYVAERFGVSVGALRRAVKAVRAHATVDVASEEPAVDPTQNEREIEKEKRERRSDLRSWIAIGLSLAFGIVGVWTGCRTSAVDDRNRQLTAKVESAKDPAYVIAADHRSSLYVRNGSPRPMLNVRALQVETDGTGREAPLFQIEMGEISGCVDASYSVAPDVARSWGPEDPPSPKWVVMWTDAGGEQWQLPAFPSDSAGDTRDVPFEGAYSPEPMARSATTDLADVPVRTGMTTDETLTLAEFGLCK